MNTLMYGKRWLQECQQILKDLISLIDKFKTLNLNEIGNHIGKENSIINEEYFHNYFIKGQFYRVFGNICVNFTQLMSQHDHMCLGIKTESVAKQLQAKKNFHTLMKWTVVYSQQMREILQTIEKDMRNRASKIVNGPNYNANRNAMNEQFIGDLRNLRDKLLRVITMWEKNTTNLTKYGSQHQKNNNNNNMRHQAKHGSQHQNNNNNNMRHQPKNNNNNNNNNMRHQAKINNNNNNNMVQHPPNNIEFEMKQFEGDGHNNNNYMDSQFWQSLNENVCLKCSKTESTWKCSKCQMVNYCSAEHEQSDLWCHRHMCALLCDSKIAHQKVNCSYCNKIGVDWQCQECKEVFYCSLPCLFTDWTKKHHSVCAQKL